MRKFLIFITCLLALSCAKEKSVQIKTDGRLTTSEAKRYYDSLSRTQQIKFLNGTSAPLSSVITPYWKRTTEVTINAYSVVEIAISIPKNELSVYHLNGERTSDDLKRSKFSLSRLMIYKDSTDNLQSNIITYIPDINYIDKGKNVYENTFLKLGSSFTGYIEFKKMDGEPYRLLRIESGKISKKYKISNSAVQKQAKVNSVMSATSCVPLCTPIYQTICSGPGGPGSGGDGDGDWVCETQQIGQNCSLVCSDGGGNFPDPGQGGPDTPGIFGLNGSNAVVQASNFGSLIDYVKSMGYFVSDQFPTTLTVDGVSYKGTMIEIYTNEGKVTASYFHINESQGAFTVGYYYSIGKGNGTNTSSWSPPFFIPETITGTNITWTNGTSSYSSVSAEGVDDLSDTDPEVAAWNDPPQPQYGVVAAPSYNKMYANYPKNSKGGDMPASEVYALVGGNILSLYQSNPKKYANACALRVSRALNYSGVQIPFIPGKTTSGADGKYYFVSSTQLYNYVKQIFSNTYKVELNATDGGPQGTLFREKLKFVKGLYIMQPNYPSKFGAMGHATLWTGTMAIGGHDYFNANGGVAKVIVWELR